MHTRLRRRADSRGHTRRMAFGVHCCRAPAGCSASHRLPSRRAARKSGAGEMAFLPTYAYATWFTSLPTRRNHLFTITSPMAKPSATALPCVYTTLERRGAAGRTDSRTTPVVRGTVLHPNNPLHTLSTSRLGQQQLPTCSTRSAGGALRYYTIPRTCAPPPPPTPLIHAVNVMSCLDTF